MALVFNDLFRIPMSAELGKRQRFTIKVSTDKRPLIELLLLFESKFSNPNPFAPSLCLTYYTTARTNTSIDLMTPRLLQCLFPRRQLHTNPKTA